MKKSTRILGLAMLAAALLAAFSFAADEEGETTAKHTIKEVMQKGNHPAKGILKKVIAGEASDEEKRDLLDMYLSLVESKPEKGEESSWQMLAGKSALAAAKVVVGREGAEKELEAATNCKACHSVHKP